MSGKEGASGVEGGASGAKTIQSLNIHSMKIDVEKFNGTNNFGLWRCEVLDALNAQNLEDTLELDGKPDEIEEKVWKKMNRTACGVIRSCLTQDLKYDVMNETSAKKIWEILESKYLTKSVENRLHLKRRLYRFQLKKGTSIRDHMNHYTKLLADLANVDVKIEDEDKALLLLSSLPDEEYETFVLTLINGKASLSYSEVTAALVNYQLRKKDKEASVEPVAEALVARGKGPNRKNWKSQSRVGKDQCAWCKETGHWKKDCPKLDEWMKNKQKGKGKQPSSEANIVSDGNNSDSSIYSLSISPTDSYSEESEWMLDSGATYHVCPRREWFSSFEKLVDSGVVYMADNRACQILGIGRIRIKMFDGTVRELNDVRYVPSLRKNLISIGALVGEGLKVRVEDMVLEIARDSRILMKGVRRNNLYYLTGGIVAGGELTTSVDSTRLRHLGLGHSSIDSSHRLKEGAKTCSLKSSEHVDVSKKTEVKCGTSIHRAKGRSGGVHVDVWGPSKGASLGGNRRLVSFVGGCSRRVWVATKSPLEKVLVVSNRLKKCVIDRKVKVLHSGGRYKMDLFLYWSRAHGIARHFVGKEILGQLDKVTNLENRALLEEDRCLWSSNGLQKSFWTEASTYLGHPIKELSTAVIGGKTPLEDRSDSVTLVEASMRKPIDSQQVESFGQTLEVSQRVESDATPHWVKITPDHSALVGIPAEVTQRGSHLDSDADDELGFDSSAADRCSLDMTIGSPQVEVFEAIGGAISRRVDDIGEGLRTLLLD